MKKEDFFRDLAELMEYDGDLAESAVLAEIEEFDSMAVMSLVAYADAKFRKKLSGSALTNAKTAGDLLDLIGRDNFS